jgi:hypothetical protein
MRPPRTVGPISQRSHDDTDDPPRSIPAQFVIARGRMYHREERAEFRHRLDEPSGREVVVDAVALPAARG